MLKLSVYILSVCVCVCVGGIAPGMGGISGAVQVVDSPLLRQQIDVQRLAIKHLKNENYRLKVTNTSQTHKYSVSKSEVYWNSAN